MDNQPTTDNQQLAQNIEALLFALGTPLARTELQKYLGVSAEELERAIGELTGTHSRGVVLVDDGREVGLRIAGGASALVERVRKEEYNRDIGRAGQETLAAVLYRGPLTRAEVDFIRGVNSQQTLRTLTMRGLLRRIPNPKLERSYVYEPTIELLSTLGIGSVEELPDYAEVKFKLQKLEEAYRAKSADETEHAESHA